MRKRLACRITASRGAQPVGGCLVLARGCGIMCYRVNTEVVEHEALHSLILMLSTIIRVLSTYTGLINGYEYEIRSQNSLEDYVIKNVII